MAKKNNGASSSFKKLKEKVELCFIENDYDTAEKLCRKIIDLYPKKVCGYVYLIKTLTKDYNKYLNHEELKAVKLIYDKAYEMSTKSEKVLLKKSFDEYLYDLKEVDNLKKIKKSIVSKEFIKNVYNDSLTFINQNMSIISSYGKNGIKIKNRYDLINGLFLFSLLIYNLFNPNYLLIFTILFGIFGIINIYSFIEMNFFSKSKYRLEKETYKKIKAEAKDEVISLKKKIRQIDEDINFIKDQKTSSITKIPQLFLNDINDLIVNDEKQIADKISSAFASSDIVRFSILLENNTNLNPNEIINHINNEVKEKNNELSKYVHNILNEKGNNQSEFILMRKVSKVNVLELVIMLVISMFSIFILFNNSRGINFEAFIVSVIIGLLSMSIYNVNTGKHRALIDTFSDNLLSTIFNSTLTYNLIYFKITNGLKLSYGFLQMPITLTLVLAGFVMLVSLIKYENLLKKLRN